MVSRGWGGRVGTVPGCIVPTNPRLKPGVVCMVSLSCSAGARGGTDVPQNNNPRFQPGVRRTSGVRREVCRGAEEEWWGIPVPCRVPRAHAGTGVHKRKTPGFNRGFGSQSLIGRGCVLPPNALESYFSSIPPLAANAPAKTSEMMAISLIRMLSDGPDVSLKGSPTVSPTTAALCVSEPFPP